MPDFAPKLRHLTKRPQFLRAARGARANGRGMSVQAVHCDDEMPGVGYTVTKKTGNSPERNRIKRRLRAAVAACADRLEPQHDYVLIGRRAALNEPFPGLVSSLESLLGRVHANRQEPKRT